MMNKKKALVKNTLIIFMGKVCTQLISFFLLPLYTSYLITSEYGIVDLITTYVTLLVPIITLELEMSIFRYLVDARGNDKKKKTLISNNFIILFISLTLFSVIYLIFTQFVDVPYRFLILLDIIICTLSGNFLQVSRGLGDTVGYSLSCIITGITTILMNILFIVVFKMGAFGMILSMALANGMCSLFLFFRLRLYKFINFKLYNKKLIKEMYKYSIPLVPNGVSWWIVNVSDRTIISFVLGSAANGIYAVSNKFPTIISSLLGIFNLSWSESAALHIDSSDRDEFFSDITNTVTKLFSSLCTGMIACLPFLFPILINIKYNDAYNYIPILILGNMFNVIVCLYSAVYIAKKMTKKVASVTVLGAIINLVVNVLLINYIGLYAASISTAVSYFVMMIYRHYDLKRYVNIKFEKGLIIKCLLIFIFSITLYYINNIYLNVINLVVVVTYAIFINKKFLLDTKNLIFSKIKSK